MNRLTDERWRELNDGDGKMTQQEHDAGHHFCLAWDGLLVSPGDVEALYCECGMPAIEAWKKSPHGIALREQESGREPNTF
jgi:hypothetical protein